MLRRLGNIFRVPDLRNKVLFTIGVICLYQAGANIPIPGVSWSQVRLLQEKAAPAVGVVDAAGRLTGLITSETIGQMLLVKDALPKGGRLGPWSRPAGA